MRIEYKNYTMETSSYGGFNLTQKVTRNKTDKNKKPTGETYDADDILGYNMKLPSCISRIMHLEHCNKDEKMQLQDYIKMYKRDVEIINNLLKI